MEDDADTQLKRRRRRKKGVSDRLQKRGAETLTARLTRLAVTIVGGLIVVIAIVGSFFVGWKMGSDRATDRVTQQNTVRVEPVRSISEVDPAARRAAMEKVDEALKRIAEGRDGLAQTLLEEASNLDPTVPGIAFERAVLIGRRGDILGGNNMLDVSISKGERIADSMIQKGSWLRQQEAGDAAGRAFEGALIADPFSAEAYFQWGETLRDAGRSLEAVEKLEKAALRSVGESDSFVIGMKLSLARAESGDNEFLTKTLPEALAKPAPSSDILLAAAAAAISNADFAEAAKWLSAAKAQMQPEIFAWALADKAFAVHQGQPELRPFYKGPEDMLELPALQGAQ